MEIEARSLSKYYRQGAVSAKGLDGASLTLRSGEFVLVSGPSGCGKSTLAKCLSLHLEPDEGDVFVDGEKEYGMAEKRRRALLASRLAYIPSDGGLVESLSALDNVTACLVSAGIPLRQAKKEALSALREAGLGKLARKKVSRLSGGERARVGIARALSSDAAVLFFDEITANLDPAARSSALELIKKKSEGRAILFISHSVEEAVPYASRHVMMEDGRIVLDEKLKPSIGAPAGEKEVRHRASFWLAGRLWASKPRRLLLSALAFLFLAAFLTAGAHFASLIYADAVPSESRTYAFENHPANRLLVEGRGDITLPEGAYDDVGDLFSSLSVTPSTAPSGGRGYALPASLLQPVMPKGDPLLGEPGGEGFYLLSSSDLLKKGSLDYDLLRERIGQEFSIYDSASFHLENHPALGKGVFRGVYLLEEGDFLLGAEYALAPSPALLLEIRSSLLSRLDEESLAFNSDQSSLFSGLIKSGGPYLSAGGRELRWVNDDDFKSYPGRYRPADGSALPKGKIYLPESLKGKGGAFRYRGTEIAISDVGSDVFYMGYPLRDGEWRLSSATLKKTALALLAERSLYFADAQSLSRFERDNVERFTLTRGDTVLKSQSAKNDSPLPAASLAGILLAGAFFSWLAGFLSRRSYKGRGADREVLEGWGYSPMEERLAESGGALVLYLLSLALSAALYFALAPSAPLRASSAGWTYATLYLIGLLFAVAPSFEGGQGK